MKKEIPQDAIEALDRYVNQGILPGGFLEAILSNQLVEAASRADFTNKGLLFEYAKYLVNEMPMRSWGSPEIVREWVLRVRGRAS